MLLISDLEIEWTKRGIRRERMILFNDVLEMNHGYITQVERTPDDGLKLTLTQEDEGNIESKYEIIFDRDDLSKLLKFLSE